MNKKALPLVIIAVLLLIIGGWYVMSQKKTSEPIPTENTVTDSQETRITNLKELFTNGLAQSCTYTSDSGNGTVYIADGKMRGDFESKNEEETITSHMIVKDNISYVWSDDQETGISMAFDPNSINTPTDDDATPVQNQQTMDLTTNYDYDCSSWIADTSIFDIPSNVTFSEFEIPNAGTNTYSSQCDYCEPLDGDEKEQCLTALKCN